MAVVVMSFSAASFAQVFISVRIGPPALPIYAQPICPGPGYMWTPGYWAWNDDGGYYWVPGTWVMAPVGMYWTPGYWGWGGGFYVWHVGYWGPHIGFYGGINYGFGYGGVGFAGGEWRGGGFYYNRSVTNVSVTNVTNVYNKTVIVNNTTVNNVSYNGGTGGVQAQPTAAEKAAMNEPHTAPLTTQTQHQTLASQNKQNFASVNQGKPAIAATAKAGDFSSHSVVAARNAGAPYHPPAMSPQAARGPSTPINSAGANAMKTTGSSGTSQNNQGFRPFTAPKSTNAQSGSSTGNATNQPKGNNTNFQPFNKPTTGTSNPPNPNTAKPAPTGGQHKATPPPPPPPKHRSPPPPPPKHGKG